MYIQGVFAGELEVGRRFKGAACPNHQRDSATPVGDRLEEVVRKVRACCCHRPIVAQGSDRLSRHGRLCRADSGTWRRPTAPRAPGGLQRAVLIEPCVATPEAIFLERGFAYFTGGLLVGSKELDGSAVGVLHDEVQFAAGCLHEAAQRREQHVGAVLEA